MPLRTLVAIVGIFFLSCVFGTVLILTHSITADNQFVVVTILGFASLSLIQLLQAHGTAKGNADAVQRTAQVEHKVDRVLNGEMEGKIEGVLNRILDERGVDKP